MFNIITRSIKRRIKDNPINVWCFRRKAREKDLLLELMPYYNSDDKVKKNNQTVICMFDGKIYQGGLADRLRGIISTYIVCKDLHMPFKIFFNHPFELQTYLSNNFDWTIDKKDISYNKDNVDIVVLETISCNDYEAFLQKRWLTKTIKNATHSQIHVYTNAFFSYKNNYSSLFNELFKLAPSLYTSIQKYREILGFNYISVSSRFLDLLGDFNEVFGRGQLSKKNAEEIIDSTLKQIKKLHIENSGAKILVNSDSERFLKEAEKFNFTYVIPGNITHIDNDSSSNYEFYEKTFLDFFMIANAKRVFLLKTGRMHNSGYPYAASLIYNKKFKVIEF